MLQSMHHIQRPRRQLQVRELSRLRGQRAEREIDICEEIYEKGGMGNNGRLISRVAISDHSYTSQHKLLVV